MRTHCSPGDRAWNVNLHYFQGGLAESREIKKCACLLLHCEQMHIPRSWSWLFFVLVWFPQSIFESWSVPSTLASNASDAVQYNTKALVFFFHSPSLWMYQCMVRHHGTVQYGTMTRSRCWASWPLVAWTYSLKSRCRGILRLHHPWNISP